MGHGISVGANGRQRLDQGNMQRLGIGVSMTAFVQISMISR
jgi:hypothetical protein